MNDEGQIAEPGRAWALLLARLLLGLLFLMAGIEKVFGEGLVENARRLFVEGYQDTFLPVWLLWPSGLAVPLVELASGVLLILGLWRKPVYVAIGGVLVMVTFGHLILEPFFSFYYHVFPRAILLLFLLWAGFAADRFSLDELR